MRHLPKAIQTAISPQSAYPWLHLLKSAQLQRVAQKTGIPSSGPKSALISNLESGLSQHQYRSSLSLPSSKREAESGEKKGKKEKKRLSILSIDMGIRNLAFAHLIIDPDTLSKSTQDVGLDGTPEAGPGAVTGAAETGKSAMLMPIPTLNAWRRLALPVEPIAPGEFGLYLDASTTTPAISNTDAHTNPELDLDLNGNMSTSEMGTVTDGADTSGTFAAGASARTFSPELYAQHAYGLISTLLARYEPTHVLIERQRFRSGGGSAVQEWTLRVGVFEGMLYAVLYALRFSSSPSFFSSSSGGLGSPPVVLGVEPQRVARYWVPDENNPEAKVKKRTSSRDGKKAKIDLVGGWLDDYEIGPGPGSQNRVEVGLDPALREWVDGYLRKWKGKRRAPGLSARDMKGGASRRVVLPEMSKLDDLADCLVQGVTWLEWQVMRERVARYGPTALGII